MIFEVRLHLNIYFFTINKSAKYLFDYWFILRTPKKLIPWGLPIDSNTFLMAQNLNSFCNDKRQKKNRKYFMTGWNLQRNWHLNKICGWKCLKQLTDYENRSWLFSNWLVDCDCFYYKLWSHNFWCLWQRPIILKHLVNGGKGLESGGSSHAPWRAQRCLHGDLR